MTDKSNYNLIDRFRSRKLFGRLPLIHVAGIVLGGIGGYLYYYYIGCQTGTCAITSNPWMSVFWGIAVGYLVFDIFHKKETSAETDQQ
jgi:hypothetical protein